MGTIKISCAMIVKNSADTLERCLNSIKDSVDEIIIVDTGSTDETIEIAKRYTSQLYDFKWVNDFSAARNFSLSKCSGDWILVIDSDEYAEGPFRSILENFVKMHPEALGKIAQINSTVTEEGTQISQCTLTRFFPRGLIFEGRVHEQVNSSKARLYTGLHVIHDGYLSENKVNRNRSLLELERLDSPENGYTLFQIARQYFIEKDYLNAAAIYNQALTHTSSTETIFPYIICDLIFSLTQLKRWKECLELIEQSYDSMCHLADFHFTCAGFFLEAAFNNQNDYGGLLPLIPDSYLLCLEIGEDESIDRIIGTGSYLAAYNLASFYEATADSKSACYYYRLAADWGYSPADARLKAITKCM